MKRSTWRLGAWLVAVASALGAGCSGGGGGAAEDDGPGGAEGVPTWAEHVAPILLDNCASCHRAGGIAPFELLTYENAVTAAGAIKLATQARSMPPFNLDNSGDCNTYVDARWLDDDEIATIAAWVDGGAPEGDPALAPEAPPPPGGLERVDATADMGETYTPDASLDDDYRCFVVDPGIAGDAFVTGAEVRPGDARTVHHVILFTLDSDAAEAAAEARDADDAGPGYTCFGGAGVPDARWIVGWAPGGGVIRYPGGTGLRWSGGRKAVMQIHYNLANGPLPDRTTIDLALAASVDKEAVMARVSAQGMSLPPGQPLAEATGTFTVPDSVGTVTVWGVAPHMHTLGKTLRVEAEQATQTACLAQVNDWNFHWQSFSIYEAPHTLAGGDTLRITCGYDTTAQHETVTSGEGTGDEMCIGLLYVTP